MLHHLVFRDCPEQEKPEIRAYWETKQPRFERLLANFRPELCHLRLAIERRKAQWEARATLSIPTAMLAARRSAETWPEALDGLADRLASELRRHEARLRHDDVRFRHGLRGATWQTAS